MAQTIALQAKHYPVDLPGIVNEAQRARANDYKLENMPLENELERMKLQSGIGQQQALDAYRNVSRETGDPVTAMKELEGYPDLQSELYKSLDAMPDSEKNKAIQRAEAFGRAAQWVLSYDDGSQKQIDAWNTSLKVLLDEGMMSPTMYEQAKQAGPSKLLLNHAMSAGKFAELYTGTRAERDQAAIALTNARKTAVEAGVDRAGTESQARIEQGNARVGIAKDKAGKTIRTGRAGGAKGGLTESQRINILRGIDKELAQMREDGADDVEIAARESFLLSRYGIASSPQELDDMTGGADQAAAPQGTGKSAAEIGQDEAIVQAREAIARGADPEMVRERLIERGYDPDEL